MRQDGRPAQPALSFGYLPTLEVLNQGGYEGGGAMRYTALPGPFAPSVEKLVIDKVHELFEKTGAGR